MRRSTVRHRLTPVAALEARDVPAVLDFTLVPASSALTLSGSVTGIGNLTQQSAGSLTTTYTGSVRADLDLAANTIGFVANTPGVVANTNGTWQPNVNGASGSAPGNYGGRIGLFVVVAAREVSGTVSTTTPLAMTGTAESRTFASTQDFTFLTGAIDYDPSILGTPGRSPITGGGANAATGAGNFIDLGTGQARLTSPIDVTVNADVNGLPATLRIVGTFVGTAPFPTADLNGAATGFDTTATFSGSPVAVLPQAEVRLLPANNLASATVVLTSRPDGAAESLAVTVGGSGLTASYNPANGTLTVTGVASLATYQTVLRTLTYANAAASPTAGARAIAVTVNDGTIDSLPHTATVTVAAPAPRVSGVAANPGAAQRSRVTSVAVTFNAPVSFAGAVANAFQLSRIGGGSVGGFSASAATVGGLTVVTLTGFTGAETEFGSLADGRYQITVLAAQVSAGGQPLDGDGNGTGGDNYVLAGSTANGLFRLFGDVNGDGSVSGGDFGAFRLAFGTSLGDPAYVDYLDFDGNGSISGGDFGNFRVRFGTGVP